MQRMIAGLIVCLLVLGVLVTINGRKSRSGSVIPYEIGKFQISVPANAQVRTYERDEMVVILVYPPTRAKEASRWFSRLSAEE